MNINKNRDVITLEETLAYIKYINREKPFDKEEIVIPTKDFQELSQVNKNKPITPKEKSKRFKVEEKEDQEITRKINKNRAIKRIIESAFQILQSFNNYEEDQGQDKGDKSSQIQFNIYLKQYNRVLQMIYKKQKQMLCKQTDKTQNHQQILQSIYEYTVVEDFRQILPVATISDKISKTNIQKMINALSQNLVVLKTNQLKIYDATTATGNFKTIKLHEIQNVDYHTQPYIFIVLTFKKDKDKFFLYLKFQSQKNQQKWDRALYCCYIGRTMKTKEKFFLIEYPQQDVKKKQKEETKKMAAFSYELQSKKTPIQKIFSQKLALSVSQKSKEQIQNEDSASRSNTRGRKMSMVKSNLNKNLSNVSKEESIGLIEQITPKQQRAGSQLGNKGTAKSNKFTVNDSQSNRAGFGIGQKNEDMINRNKTDYININKSGQAQTPHDKQYTQRNNPAPFGSYSQIQEQNKNQPNDFMEKPEELLPADIKKIHDLQRKHIKGIILQKQKFFFNKAKIVYFKQNSTVKLEQQPQNQKLDIQSIYQAMRQRQIQYWDFDSKSGQKTQRKIIRLIKISKCQIKDEKYLLVEHQNKKQITFTGNLALLQEIYQYINLIKNIYKSKLNMI